MMCVCVYVLGGFLFVTFLYFIFLNTNDISVFHEEKRGGGREWIL